eukprot:scaffold5231_cov119-Isochrysis_galbana.AAC.11
MDRQQSVLPRRARARGPSSCKLETLTFVGACTGQAGHSKEALALETRALAPRALLREEERESEAIGSGRAHPRAAAANR